MSNTLYQIKVTLMESRPPIWRRLNMPGALTLDKFHEVVQIAMGWTASHPYEFHIKSDVLYPEDFSENERKLKPSLKQLVENKIDKFVYLYDSDDNWKHEVFIEKACEGTHTNHAAHCIDGEGVCPPENCGGIYGYREILEILANPTHQSHESTRTWIANYFERSRFELNWVNAQLAQVKWE